MSEAATPPAIQIGQPASAALSHAEIMRVMAGVMICILLAALDQTVVIPALPAIASELGAYSQLSWIVAAYLITSTISTPIYSKLSDIFGRRRLLIVCIALFMATSVLCAVAQSLSQLVWFRALQGLGGGGLMALTQAAIADVMSPRQRARYQAYISLVWAVSSVSGPLVGGFLAESLSFGAGTGALLVLRSVGGASGSTLAGTIIASGLIAIQKAGSPAHSVQPGATALADAANSGLNGAATHLRWGFGMVYAVAAVFAAITFAVTLWMPDARLRELPLLAGQISE